MEKRLYNFNIALIILGVLCITSSVILKVSSGNSLMNINYGVWVWIHIVTSIITTIAVIYHLYLHWGKMGKWIKHINKLNSKISKILGYLSILVMVSGMIATVWYITTPEINIAGKLHGKVGIMVMILTVIHGMKRIKWFRGRKEGRALRITLDEEKCVNCGLCIKDCPANIFTMNNKRVEVGNTDYCFQCRKCIVKCPKGAIS